MITNKLLGYLEHFGMFFTAEESRKNASKYLLRLFAVETGRVIKISLSCLSAHVIDKAMYTSSSQFQAGINTLAR